MHRPRGEKYLLGKNYSNNMYIYILFAFSFVQYVTQETHLNWI